MALDKQRILNELGSVVNQLQSADCGCMGRLFGNQNPSGNCPTGAPLPTCGGCRRGCCHGHGYNNNNNNNYNYGGNGGDYAAMNSSNMGNPGAPCGRANPAKLYADTYGYLNQNMMQPAVQEVYNDLKSISPANTIMNNPMAQQLGLSQQNPQMQGQGMMPGQKMMAGSSGDGVIPGQANQMANPQHNMHMPGMGPDILSMMMKGGGGAKPMNSPVGGKLTESMIIDAPNSPHGKVGVQPLSSPMGQYNTSNNLMMQSPQTVQHMQSNMVPTTHNPNANANLGGQIPAHSPCGHGHRHGGPEMKFNEMFPGVMKTFGQDLGFDPMAIAIQMNPDNAKRAAMDTMQKMMSKKPITDKLLAPAPTPAPVNAEPQAAELLKENEPKATTINPNLNEQKVHSANISAPAINQPQEEIVSGVPVDNSPNSFVPPVHQTAGNTAQGRTPEPLKPEPILPVDTSKNEPHYGEKVYYQYNTLGQPVELIPAKMFHTAEQPLPQTLSPKPVPMSQLLGQSSLPYSNVKSTMSKTSIVGKNLSRTASRSQLKHLYNQYRGSQSVTQQNIQQPTQKTTHSEGRLIEPQIKEGKPAPVEKVAGDTIANNVLETKQKNVDIPAPLGKRGHNGLQDIKFTSYPTAAAWSFHG